MSRQVIVMPLAHRTSCYLALFKEQEMNLSLFVVNVNVSRGNVKKLNVCSLCCAMQNRMAGFLIFYFCTCVAVLYWRRHYKSIHAFTMGVTLRNSWERSANFFDLWYYTKTGHQMKLNRSCQESILNDWSKLLLTRAILWNNAL